MSNASIKHACFCHLSRISEKPEVQVTEDVVDLTLEQKVTTEVTEEATIKGERGLQCKPSGRDFPTY